MRFGLIANLRRVGATDAVNDLIKWVEENDQQLVLGRHLKEIAGSHLDFVPRDELANQVDIIICMGGDGTILAAARDVGSIGTPLLGINLGSLGFLTQHRPMQLTYALDAVLAGEYKIEERMLLKAQIEGRGELRQPYALNDVVLDNGPVSRVLEINLQVNGEDVVNYVADGLVIATPTGSTAYNLAVGGPIMHPKMEAMIASPIAPFSLTTRPMIIPGEDRLDITILSQDRKAILSLDGQVHEELHAEEQVTISRADFRARFVVFPDISYYELLRSKLNWGVPPNFMKY